MEFIKKVWQLTTLRLSPEALPYHHLYLWIGIGLNFALSYIVAISFPETEIELKLTSLKIMLMKAVNLFFLALILYCILMMVKKINRFSKLFLAIVAGTFVIELVNFGISLFPALLKYMFKMDLDANVGAALFFSLMVCISIAWMIIFMGHIFRFGLDVSRLKGIWIGIAYILVSGMFSIMIFGNPFEALV